MFKYLVQGKIIQDLVKEKKKVKQSKTNLTTFFVFKTLSFINWGRNSKI